MRKIVDAEEYNVPSTIDDPAILREIKKIVSTLGYGKKYHHREATY
jgi:hypothetical protein